MSERTCHRCTAKLGEEHRNYCAAVGLVTEEQLTPVEPLPEQVHLAGPDLKVGSVQRQRCVWCGALILEYDLANLAFAVEPGEEPPSGPAMYATGVLVLTTGTWPVMSTVVEAVLHPDGIENVFSIPENSCMALDVEVTR